MIPVIICGGTGTKMWPESRERFPKHFLPLFNGRSLFQINWESLRKEFKPKQIFIQTNKNQARIAKQQVKELLSENIFIEPETRNTGPACGFTAAMLYKKHPDEPFILIQADDLREPGKKLLKMIRVCDRLAKTTGKYITGGFRPSFPVMGVDYLIPGERVSNKDEVGVYKVKKFLWRSSKKEVEKYLVGQKALLHANHSCMTPRGFLEMYKKYRPDWYGPLLNIIGGASVVKEYKKMPKGPQEEVTEHVHKDGDSLVVELPFAWTDFGTWESLMKYTAGQKGLDQNNLEEISASGNFVRAAKDKKVALVGVDDLIIVDTKDALLVCRKDFSGQVGEVVQRLKNKGEHKWL